MDAKKVINIYNEYVMPNYTRKGLVIKKAKGSWVYSADGKKYLDFFPGWAVSGLGHCHKRVVKAVQKQAAKVMHVSNNYYNEVQGELAQKLSLNSFGGKVFFCNSGAEANEAAFKLARAFGNPQRNEVITAHSSFHGRTLACTAATGQDKCKLGFEPLPAGFKSVPFNDKEALKVAVSDKTAAIMIELIQGEGGIKVAEGSYVRFIRDLCDKNNMLFIVDEVQTGMGRTGKMFAYQHYGLEPDIITLAKSLGGGMPIGATIVQKRIAGTLRPGMHASTFGGNPVACSGALGVFEAIEKEQLLKNTVQMGTILRNELIKLKGKYPLIRQIRGMGLMLGVELIVNGPKAYEYCFAKGLLINCTQDNTLRIMPSMAVTKKEIMFAMKTLEKAISRC
ncbi:MAG: aspartate aminotransferase family protein [Candidatus Omnitrophica bacterium]|nr:aspartate aminotransferase family protein [Candidatus Omnitrophota bacterium]